MTTPRFTLDELRTNAAAVTAAAQEGVVSITDADGAHRFWLSIPGELRCGCEESGFLLELLARIHGDGGHHVDEHGTRKSYEDADAVVVADRQRIDELRSALREACDLVERLTGDPGPRWNGWRKLAGGER